MAPARLRRWLVWPRVGALISGLFVLLVLALVVPAAVAYRDIERVDFDPSRFGPSARPPAPGEEASPFPTYAVPPGSAELDGSTPSLQQETVVLLIGSDSREGLEDLTNFGDFEGRRADVIILLIARPEQPPALVSVPRDLWVTIPCSGEKARINEALEGCGIPADGPSVLAAATEALTGKPVDHYVEVDLAGFPQLIDLVGGVEVCVDHPTRDRNSGLDLEAGCHSVGGDQALAWIRSRYTEQRVDGRWQQVGANDLDRNRRQRELLMEVFGEVRDMRSPADLVRLATLAGEHLSVDRSFDLVRASEIAWSVRGLDPQSIISTSIPVTGEFRGDASVLVPTVDVETWLEQELDRNVTTARGHPRRL